MKKEDQAFSLSCENTLGAPRAPDPFFCGLLFEKPQGLVVFCKKMYYISVTGIAFYTPGCYNLPCLLGHWLARRANTDKGTSR